MIPYSKGDGLELSYVTVPVGTTVFNSVAGANRLESIWGSDAKEWKPERWLNNSDPTNPTAPRLPGIYSGMMSFFGGGRSCMQVDCIVQMIKYSLDCAKVVIGLPCWR